MMGALPSVPELVATAQTNAKTSENRISEILKLLDGQNGSDAQVEELRAATVALELTSVDIFSVFEARMQNTFKRGPFARKLKTMLVAAEQADLAERFHLYYLAINVLKHGKGASYRELLNDPSTLIVVRPAEDTVADETLPAVGLIDVTVPGFFDGLSTTILEAYHFLENR
ncbi:MULTISPECIES: hypothetical protein [Falsihalocynthiibacter]|uniref:hypothetical protein n=1 Tax=Falsihalocynthiibacter TaxID=2854182 RepID=UPI0030022B6C